MHKQCWHALYAVISKSLWVMKKPRKLYINEKWYEFSGKVKQRDEYKCLQCGRREPEVILQVHHEIYVKGKAPWEYPLSDCRTLCKGCHAREHKLIEPDKGWTGYSRI